MIHIKRPVYPPVVKFIKGRRKGIVKWVYFQAKVIKDFETDNSIFLNGNYKFDDDYGFEEFRNEMLKYQGEKCCFCEKPIGRGYIEHYRPKACYQEESKSPISRPGYYWLCYRWENLLLSCNECNSGGQKGSLFPITGSRGTALLGCLTENPVIINPCSEEPTKYISFNLDQPVGVDSQGRGENNIKIFKLKIRPDIKSSREDKLNLYNRNKMIASLPGPTGIITQSDINLAKIALNKAMHKKEPFAGMIRENVKKGFI